MKFKLIFIKALFITYSTAAMEVQQKTGLENMLLSPASLVFQAAWHATRTNQPIEKVGAEHVMELSNKIKNIQQITDPEGKIKKFLIKCLNNPEFFKENKRI